MHLIYLLRQWINTKFVRRLNACCCRYILWNSNPLMSKVTLQLCGVLLYALPFQCSHCFDCCSIWSTNAIPMERMIFFKLGFICIIELCIHCDLVLLLQLNSNVVRHVLFSSNIYLFIERSIPTADHKLFLFLLFSYCENHSNDCKCARYLE